MGKTGHRFKEFPFAVVALILLAVPPALFWRAGFFYILDDWTSLIHMVSYPFWQYVVTPDGDQWFPLFNLVYYGLVKVVGENYGILVLVNCLGTGVNALLIYLFLRRQGDR